MLSKEEIEKIKDGLRKQLFNVMQANECGLSNNDFKEDIEVLKGAIQYIDDLEQENNKQNKMIDEMIDMISSLDFTINMVAFGGQARFGSKEEIKQCFEKKVDKNKI